MPFDHVETPAYVATVEQEGLGRGAAAIVRAVPWGRLGGVDDGRPADVHELSMPDGGLISPWLQWT